MDPWPRDRLTTGGGPARVALIALAPTALPDPLPVSRKRHGIPEGDGVAALSVCPRHAGEHAAWFDGFRTSGFAALIAEDLGAEALAAALACDHACVIEAEVDDPDDLGHLQAAWALAVCTAELGAVVVVDVLAGRAWAGADVAALDPARGFDIAREVTILAEDLAPAQIALFTRGLIKVGRTELVATPIDPAEAAGVAHFLRDLADSLAAGELLELGDAIQLSDGTSYAVTAPDPALLQRLGIDQPAVVLTPGTGSGGVRQRHRLRGDAGRDHDGREVVVDRGRRARRERVAFHLADPEASAADIELDARLARGLLRHALRDAGRCRVALVQTHHQVQSCRLGVVHEHAVGAVEAEAHPVEDRALPAADGLELVHPVVVGAAVRLDLARAVGALDVPRELLWRALERLREPLRALAPGQPRRACLARRRRTDAIAPRAASACRPVVSPAPRLPLRYDPGFRSRGVAGGAATGSAAGAATAAPEPACVGELGDGEDPRVASRYTLSPTLIARPAPSIRAIAEDMKRPWLAAVVVSIGLYAPAVAEAQTAQQVVTDVETFYANKAQATARFQQLVTDPNFGGAPTVSGGTLLVEKPGKMRWDYDAKRKGQTPKKNFIADGKDLYYVDHVNKQVVIHPLTGGMMPAAVSYLNGAGSLSKNFTAALATSSTYAKAGHTVVELTPVTPSASIKLLVLVVDASGQVAKTVVIDSQDRTNEFELYDPNFKTAIAKTQFVFDRKKHKNYKIVDQRPKKP